MLPRHIHPVAPSATTAIVHHPARPRPMPRRLPADREPLYRVFLSATDLRLVQACITYHTRLQTDAEILRRFDGLRRRLAAAHPWTTDGADAA
jgi:hypothetical protein